MMWKLLALHHGLETEAKLAPDCSPRRVGSRSPTEESNRGVKLKHRCPV